MRWRWIELDGSIYASPLEDEGVMECKRRVGGEGMVGSVCACKGSSVQVRSTLRRRGKMESSMMSVRQ